MMAYLLALLGLSWPSIKTEFGPPKPLPPGMIARPMNPCCGSMKPSIKGGELAYWSRPLPGEKLVGQIIDNGEYTHLVVAENERAVYTTGTANRHSDGWTPREKIRYVVRYIVR